MQPNLFDDDNAGDLREEYRSLLMNGLSDEEATSRVIADLASLSESEEKLVWVALAVAQAEVGRLEPDVRDRALAVIESGFDEDTWDYGGPALAEERRSLLSDIRAQLTGPQPRRRRMRRPWTYRTDLQLGDLLTWTPDEGPQWQFVVTHLAEENSGVGVTPWLRRVRSPGTGGPAELVGQPIAAHKRRAKERDWHELGFDRTHTPLADWSPAWMSGGVHYLTWEDLVEFLADGDLSWTEELPPLDEPLAALLGNRQGQLTVVTLDDGRQVQVMVSELVYASGDGYASVIVNAEPGLTVDADVFTSRNVSRVEDPSSGELLFLRP